MNCVEAQFTPTNARAKARAGLRPGVRRLPGLPTPRATLHRVPYLLSDAQKGRELDHRCVGKWTMALP